MELLHVSFEPVEQFIPRIPEERHINENQTIPRICLSDDIKLALRAIPYAGSFINFFLKRGFKPFFYVYRLRSEKIGHMFPSEENLSKAINYCSRKNIYAVLDESRVSDYVADARLNHEYWLLVKPEMTDFICEKFKITDIRTDKMYSDDIASYFDYIQEIEYVAVTNDGQNNNLAKFIKMFKFKESTRQQEFMDLLTKYGLRTIVTYANEDLEEKKDEN